MTVETRIRELLEEILETGSAPEEACAGSPELLFEVQQQLKRLRSVENQLEELFPSSCPISGDGTGSASRSSSTAKMLSNLASRARVASTSGLKSRP